MTLLRGTFRSLRQSPGFALTVVLTLALGIGLTDAIFTVVDCVLLRPLGYRDADRLVALCTTHYPNTTPQNAVAGDDFTDLAHDIRGLESAAFYAGDITGIRIGEDAAYVRVTAVSPAFAEVMGVTPLAGRLFDSTQSLRSQNATDALISAAFAREHFGSAAAALGKVLHADTLTRTIVGVLPDGFRFPLNTAVWVEVGSRPDTASRTAYNQAVVAKRRNGTTSEALAAELDTEAHRLATAYSEDRGKQFAAVPLADEIEGQIRPTLRLLLGAVAVVLLLVCTNLTHLQIVRGSRRLHATAVRKALGASRGMLLRDALFESMLLAGAGALGAFLLAMPAVKVLLRFAPPTLPRLAEIRPNADVLLLSCAVSAVLMAVTAVLPTLQIWGTSALSALRNDAARGMDPSGVRRFRNTLLGAEVALTLMLSVAALLLARQLIAQGHAELGFSPEHLLTLDTHMTAEAPLPEIPETGTAAQKAIAFQNASAVAETWLKKIDSVLATVRGTPGVSAAAAMNGAPMGFGGPDVLYAIHGRQVFGPEAHDLPGADIHAVTPALLTTLGVPLLQGRALTDQDRLGTPSVLLINAALAHQQFPNQNPIGQQIMCGADWDVSWWTIVGVVGDIRSDTPGKPPVPTFYVPLAQHPQVAMYLQLVVRTQSDSLALTQTLRSRLKQQHPDVAVQITTMRENIADTQRLDHLRSLLFGGFAIVSLVLAALGIYGVTAYSVSQRRFEFGLRLAVGATRPQLLRMVVSEAVRTSALGAICGALAATAFTRWLGSVVGALPPFDGWVYGTAVLFLLGWVVLAALAPARHAAGTEPMQVLRSE